MNVSATGAVTDVSMVNATESSGVAIEFRNVSRSFPGRKALDGVSLTVERNEAVALLGPNGSGKTTLFRIASTLLQPDAGSAWIFGLPALPTNRDVRRLIGVVFQSPSLDPKLTAEENLKHHGHLYGLRGRALRGRINEMLERLGVSDRRKDRIETLSGGLARRVEIAKGMLPGPRLLLLDEPSTGLDPRARRELWSQLDALRRAENVSILLTTHILDEAERCDRVVLMDRGRLVAEGAPSELKARIGGEIITIETDEPDALADQVRARFDLPARVVDQAVLIETEGGAEWIPKVAGAFSQQVRTITLGKPTLEDVFVHLTGRHFEAEDA